MKFKEILSLFRQGKSSTQSHIKALIEIAAADGNFDDVEYNLLQQIGKRNNVSEKKLKEIKNNPELVEFEVPEDPVERFTQMYDLVHMMIVDKHIYHEEMKLCNLFAVRFEYPKNKIDEIINIIKGNIENKNDAHDTFQRVEWMLK